MPVEPAIAAATVAEFAPSGALRVGINLGNPVIAQRDPGGGDPKGVGPALGRELAKRLGVSVQYVTYDTAGKVADAVKEGAWDVAFLAVDPARAVDIDFTAAYVHIEGTYLVRDDSPCRQAADLDREGMRIAVGLKTAYDLYLTRELKHAKLVRAPVGGASAGIPVFVEQKLEAAAGVRQALDFYAKDHPEVRVMTGAFQQIRQAMVTPKNKAAGLAYMKVFVEEMKASGMVVASLKASGMAEVSVAPPEK